MEKNVPFEKHVLNSFNVLREEVLDLYLPKQVPSVKERPQPSDFYRNYVSPNLPVLLKGAVQKLPAHKKWNKEFLCKSIKDKLVTVTVTPNGYGDALTETIINNNAVEVFALAEERKMYFEEFFKMFDEKKEKTRGVFYLQTTHSNLTEEFPQLLEDIEEFSHWTTEIFKNSPTAINLWAGDERAVTSLHKNPFENVYCIISGSKEFILLPPTDRPWLPYKTLPVGQYREVSPGRFEIEMLEADEKKRTNNSHTSLEIIQNKISWIAIDPASPDTKRYPMYKRASPIKVKVHEGDALYIPSLWFHYVKQAHRCIAVNYWYDMSFDIKYAYFQMLDHLVKKLQH